MTGKPVRRAQSYVAAAAVLALGLAACSGNGGDDSGGGSGSGGDDVLNVLVLKHALTGPMEGMQWVSELEEQADVSIRWEEISADWDQAKSTMLAAGDIPDLIVGTNAITDSDLSTFTGLFEDLSQHMESLPNVRAMFDEIPEMEVMAQHSEGAIYALPGYKRFWPETVTHQYINQEWLDNLGLEVPTTWDELFDVLVAFKEEDANGSGDPHDEIPMDWAPTGSGGFGYFQPTVLMGSLGLPLTGGGGPGYFVEDGEVKSFLVDERYREVVAFLHRCYAEGLISEEVMTQDYSAYQSVGRGSGDTARVGLSWGWTASDRFGSQLAPQYTAMAPLLAEEGQDESDLTWTYDSYGENFPQNQIVMSAQSGNAEAALRVINAFYDQDISLQVLWGDMGTNIEQIDENTYEVLPPADGETDPSSWKWTTTLADNGPTWIRDDIDVEIPVDLSEAVEEAEPLEGALANMDLVADVFPWQFITLTPEDQTAVANRDVDILGVAMTNWGVWITGGGIEEDWDSYIQQVENSGLNENIEIYQRYYDEYVAALD
ncbi:extracellular solute-binding protein [Bogoriella caseilytica]|uniref:Carbohydrate ABC transporter substrate-binding protein (CUT1 family) n=1 Tax=Bogoriella caseilytica TaxID=56055 RepID=A0A3N2BFQ7_9MICO|nr:extracellular solute-binding protein [Bogoriella caseilytica]ROR74082.1 carbohydrate ABC transporter substrate-binding protein (CUT1 family) [Bogoriella caseilytica]